MKILFMVLFILTALFLILIVLVQRGKGGGLAGALGGMGGQSAFGAKAGDLFTRITIGVAAFWIILCICGVAFLTDQGRMTGDDRGGADTQTQQSSTDQPDTGNSTPEKSDS
jgi:preprotein translocase subunit SecG